MAERAAKGAEGDVSKDRRRWAKVKQAAEKRLAGLGGRLIDSSVDYEIARWVSPELTLILYQHKTSAWNYHCRVRAGECKSRDMLRRAIHALAENSCQFQFPSEKKFHDEGVQIALSENRSLTHGG